MVAKINTGSSLFGVLAYNAEKVTANEAKVLATNKVFDPTDGSFDMTSCLRDFESYMPNHCRTEKPVIHISLNPHPDDILSDEQLRSIAEEYIQRLGYGKQPYVVFKHEDIDRHHLHIVSLRVDEAGRKLNDKFEHRRSKAITKDLEQKYGLHDADKIKIGEYSKLKRVDVKAGNIKRQIGNVIRFTAQNYKIQSFPEYRAFLSLYNISAEEVKGEIKGKSYNGIVYSATDENGNKVGNPFKSSLFGKSVGYEALQKRFIDSTAIIKTTSLASQTKVKILDVFQNSANKKAFRENLRNRGVDIVLRENSEGRIYGATFIDHQNQCVFNGSRLGKELSANSINDKFCDAVEEVSKSAQEVNYTTYNHMNNESVFGGLFDFSNNPTYDPDEERFRRQMQRKNKKKNQFRKL